MRPDLNLFLVADGAGGQNAGNVASSLAVTTIAHFFEQTQDGADTLPEFDELGLHTSARRLSAAVQEANKEILEIARTSDKHRGMGTTVAAALFDPRYRIVHIAYVGDSRCYRLRDGRLEQLTHDHSLINDVLELRPNISDERVKKLPQNVITRALGMMENLRVSVRSHEVCHGDRYLLCSDGLSDNVDDGQVLESLMLDIGCDEEVELLMSMALEAGASDNVATIIIDCALPHTSASKRAVSTRPLKKKSRPKLPAVRVPAARGIEESVPEIVLYDRPEGRDSTPLIHVVPAASRSPEVMVALQEEEQVTKEYESPLAAMAALDDPTGGEPPLRTDPPAPSVKPPSSGPAKPPRDPATKVMETDHAALREAAEAGLPDPTGGDLLASLDDPDDPPTQVVRTVPAALKPAARAKPKAKTAQAARTKKAKVKTKARVKPRPKGAGAPVSSRGGALGTPRASTKLPRKAKPPAKPKPRVKPTAGADASGSKAKDNPDRGEAIAIAAATSGRSEKKVSAPRRNKPNVTITGFERRSGDTKAPPGASDSPFPADSTPPPPDAGRMTLTGPLPSPNVKITPDSDGLPLPPVRPPFETTDFTNDSVPCHACGSIIMRTADICMYCGAPTGFVSKDNK